MSAFPRGGTPRSSEPKTIWLTLEVPGDIPEKVPELEKKLEEAAGKLFTEASPNRIHGTTPSIKVGHADKGKLKIVSYRNFSQSHRLTVCHRHARRRRFWFFLDTLGVQTGLVCC